MFMSYSLQISDINIFEIGNLRQLSKKIRVIFVKVDQNGQIICDYLKYGGTKQDLEDFLGTSSNFSNASFLLSNIAPIRIIPNYPNEQLPDDMGSLNAALLVFDLLSNNNYPKVLKMFKFSSFVDDYQSFTTKLNCYEIDPNPIGYGAFGVVKRVQDKKYGLWYAMKVINIQRFVEKCSQFDKNIIRKKILMETEIQRIVKSPNIITINEQFESDDDAYIIMELASKYNLKDYVNYYQQSISFKEILYILTQICNAIQVVHNNGIIHRDIKPENFLICESGIIKLCDFGFAIKSQDASSFLGTPLYMAPEVIQNEKYTAAADIFSFGCVIYFMLTQKLAFGVEQGNYMRVLKKILEGEPDPIPLGKYPDQIQQLCKQMLQKDPQLRPNIDYVKQIIIGLTNQFGNDTTTTVKNILCMKELKNIQNYDNKIENDEYYQNQLDKYEIDPRFLFNQGSYDYVKRIKDKQTELWYTLKCVNIPKLMKFRNLLSEKEAVDRIMSEIQLQQKIQSPYIIQIQQFFQINNDFYIIMELATQNTLDFIVKGRKDPLSTLECLNYMIQLSKAIQAIHDCGIMHRGITAESFISCEDGKLKQWNFGFAEECTEADSYLGTPIYMAPEQLKGGTYTKQVDIFALGCIFYYLMMQKHAFAVGNFYEISQAILEKEPEVIPLGKYPDEVIKICNIMLSKDPKMRPQIYDILQSLQKIMEREVNSKLLIGDHIEESQYIISESTNYKKQNQEINSAVGDKIAQFVSEAQIVRKYEFVSQNSEEKQPNQKDICSELFDIEQLNQQNQYLFKLLKNELQIQLEQNYSKFQLNIDTKLCTFDQRYIKQEQNIVRMQELLEKLINTVNQLSIEIQNDKQLSKVNNIRIENSAQNNQNGNNIWINNIIQKQKEKIEILEGQVFALQEELQKNQICKYKIINEEDEIIKQYQQNNQQSDYVCQTQLKIKQLLEKDKQSQELIAEQGRKISQLLVEKTK